VVLEYQMPMAQMALILFFLLLLLQVVAVVEVLMVMQEVAVVLVGVEMVLLVVQERQGKVLLAVQEIVVEPGHIILQVVVEVRVL
jgi:hypothetical protein